MTIKLNQVIAPRFTGSTLPRIFGERFICAIQTRKRKPEEGGLLVEVLVGMMILVVVFTATTIGLSNMAEQRVRIEQRDRALAIASNYEELSRTFKCGFVVDRIADSLSSSSAPNQGFVDFKDKVRNCDFAALNDGNIPENAGDQDFTKVDIINENGSEQLFVVTIRYWYEVPGTDRHLQTCGTLSGIADELPIMLTRHINVSWEEKGMEREISIIKRDSVPTDNVVFASGSRVSALAKKPDLLNTVNNSWEASFYPYPGEDLYIMRYMDREENRLEGQPVECAWFPYVTADDEDREITFTSYNSSDVPHSYPTIPKTIPTNTVPQGFVIFA